ncbi:hypothetical protein IY145_00745 [Methylosinus sp. H3A]|uniref:hypothetical protein n=1 Tax=Methylosinus sp. H3A TaxID=2785786 RepID=UPI0018C32DFF|nr:hypothetical protein [Methylosinus sp. H3A]MBG0807958.1 hypothetical protein [Methylosinus sp. H3A]
MPIVASTSLITTLTAMAPPALSPSLVTSFPVEGSVTVCLPLVADAWPKMVASAMSGLVKMSLYFVGLNLLPTSGLALPRVCESRIA